MSWHATALADGDNVAVLLAPAVEGQTVIVDAPAGRREIVAREAIPLCHKIALADIAAGAPVLKYGECIGEARTAIAAGAWVHVHNLRSRRAQAAG